MTDKQKLIYEEIKKFIQDNGYAPSIRELCKLLDKSPQTIFLHLKHLKELGYITYEEKKSRTIRIIKEG